MSHSCSGLFRSVLCYLNPRISLTTRVVILLTIEKQSTIDEDTTGLRAMLACYSSCFVIVCCTTLYLYFLNARNMRRRVLAGKSAQASGLQIDSRTDTVTGARIIDYSMLSVQEAEIARTKARQNLENLKTGSGDPSSLEGRGAFDDMTDLQNDEFIVSLFLCQEISIEADTSS